jgi:hypothetical protein
MTAEVQSHAGVIMIMAEAVRRAYLEGMDSKLAAAIGLATSPVALVWSDSSPEGATHFKPGRWGCVVAMFAAAAKGRVGAFDRETYGCWGGGVGLGFGNCYESFPGGVEGFCGFLANGNQASEEGRRVGEQLRGWGQQQMADDFLQGERYLQNRDTTRKFLATLPLRDIPAKYVVVEPLGLADPEREDIKSVTFFATPDQISALVVLANYTDPERENVAVPWGAACQVMGIFAYKELEREHPRALIGLTDLSARHHVRASLGSNVLSFTMPWPVFQRMEQNADGSFLDGKLWRELQSHAAPAS